ncbi:DEAD/DEAH box helicase [Nocardioides limicola]|uniref:DEAD/DEAH box helicase n=1 Tax=Nocardioides limicola TaxID=2803368 RepID=UPI00193C00F9|nr:DEAD/DEAH box helicase [Nocardioides sp. DJM-14]
MSFEAFAAGYEFGLDDFQIRACRKLDGGGGVLVAAPTGSGKTVVGEYAVHLALSEGRKCFYTTPIKALSNQKYADLVARHGADKVGMLTGDNSINSEAPVVVMTTEVLRNMLYAGSRTLTDLGYVVMDEVHYLADRSRGAVWEEVIIHLPESVALVSLSATVSNAEEFGEWLATVRGEISTIVSERRPVPLFQHVMVGKRMYDLFAGDAARSGFADPDAKVNRELIRVARDEWASKQMRDRRAPRNSRGQGRRNVGNGRRVWIPSRAEVITRLERDGLLPAITFIFSRVGCDAAVQQCIDANVRLTNTTEQQQIREFVTEHCRHLPEEDRVALGYHEFLDGLLRGVAAHHAGMLPTFKECVERLFQRGLCKGVFATETLALGINMPARTVVIEKLTKWNGETHADITPGEYTQLTGRAGRRGLDVEGHAVVLWQPGTRPEEVAGLASTRTYPLRSSFRPSYNMAVNLVHRFGRERARELLESSFAQFQADKAVVGLARKLRKSDDALDGYAEGASCDRGDFMAYARLRQRIGRAEKQSSQDRRGRHRDEVIGALTRLTPGDVIWIPGGRHEGWAVVIDPGLDRHEPRPLVVSLTRGSRRLAVGEIPAPVRSVTQIRVPRQFNDRDPKQRRDLTNTLRNRVRHLEPPPPPERRRPDSGPDVDRMRVELKSHPCHDCPDREDHARWAERWLKLDSEARALRNRIEKRTNTIARQFDRVCDLLTTLEYLDGDTVTERGQPLMRIYSELDLVAAESLRTGLWNGLTPEELAATVSVLAFESRRPDDASRPRLPNDRVRQVVGEMVSLWGDLDALERENRLDFLREPDLGFAQVAFRWASGDDLDDVLRDTELAAGDFVRWMKQLLDLTDQVADAAGDGELRRTARRAHDLLRRGVVAYSSMSE